MAFLLKCPNCGERSVYEFRFGGEVNPRPDSKAASDDWAKYYYSRQNVAGEQDEWWYHNFGCRKWFVAVRDTVTNHVEKTFWQTEAN